MNGRDVVSSTITKIAHEDTGMVKTYGFVSYRHFTTQYGMMMLMRRESMEHNIM